MGVDNVYDLVVGEGFDADLGLDKLQDFRDSAGNLLAASSGSENLVEQSPDPAENIGPGKRILVLARTNLGLEYAEKLLKRKDVAAVYFIKTDADEGAPHTLLNDPRVITVDLFGKDEKKGSVAETLKKPGVILDFMKKLNVTGILPGYGPLSESPEFAAACREHDFVLLDQHGNVISENRADDYEYYGPNTEALRLLGNKLDAKETARDAGLAVADFSGELTTLADALEEAKRIGYPVILKALAGGGGDGIRVCRNADDVKTAIKGDAKKRILPLSEEAQKRFGNGAIFMEKFLGAGTGADIRHIEVQIACDVAGGFWADLRDCSVQKDRRKFVEKAGDVVLNAMRAKWAREGIGENKNPTEEEMKARAHEMTNKLLKGVRNFVTGDRVRYNGIGTVEFLLDVNAEEFYFMEVNPRIQVEYLVTELSVSKPGEPPLNLMDLQIDLAEGALLADHPLCKQQIEYCDAHNGDFPPPSGRHTIEARVYAFDVEKQMPMAGQITKLELPQKPSADIHYQLGVTEGTKVTLHLGAAHLGNIVVTADTAEEARKTMSWVLEHAKIEGVPHSIELLKKIINSPEYRAGQCDIDFLDRKYFHLLYEEKLIEAFSDRKDELVKKYLEADPTLCSVITGEMRTDAMRGPRGRNLVDYVVTQERKYEQALIEGAMAPSERTAAKLNRLLKEAWKHAERGDPPTAEIAAQLEETLVHARLFLPEETQEKYFDLVGALYDEAGLQKFMQVLEVVEERLDKGIKEGLEAGSELRKQWEASLPGTFKQRKFRLSERVGRVARHIAMADQKAKTQPTAG